MSFDNAINVILPPAKSERVRLTSPMGPRWGRVHKGVDLSYTKGQGGVISSSPPIYSPVSGVVVRVGPKSGWHEVTIKDSTRQLGGRPIFHRFLHNETVLVQEGQSVSAGQQIARVGKRKCAHYHVHYEVRVGGVGGTTGTPLNPVTFWNGEKQVYVPDVPKEELKDPHATDEKHYKTEAGAAPIPDTPEESTVLEPPKQPTGQIEDYMPRQAAVAAYSEAQGAVWTNRVPEHEPWARGMLVNSENLNAPSDEIDRNTRHNPQYDVDHKDSGRVEGETPIERGPFWRR